MTTIIVALPTEFDSAPRGYDIVYSGVGKVNATIAAMDAINNGASQIINYGTAGLVSSKTKLINTLVEVDVAIQRDMLAQPLAPRGITPYETGTTAGALILNSGTDITIGTGDSFVMRPDEWFRYSSVDIVDMECYSIAKVCKQKEVFFKSYKWVTDFADENASIDWQENIANGEKAFRKILV